MTLTILVPTYNRKEFLKRLFQSLEIQTNKEFQLLIMDDGSSDHSEELIEQWNDRLTIEYHYHENMGKSKTLVKALQYLNSEYVFILDSDAVLIETAVATILNDIASYGKDAIFGGLFYCMQYPDGKLIGKNFDHPETYTTFQRALDFDARGDKAVIIRTNFLKQVEMPVFEDEKFITESVFMNRVSLLCKCICRNDIIMITDYQEDGLTANIKNFWKLYPKGYHLFFLERINYHKLPFVKYISSVVALVVFAFRSQIGYINTWKKIKGFKNKACYFVLTPIGILCRITKMM